jgi:uncharacterized lipoprotein YmbA
VRPGILLVVLLAALGSACALTEKSVPINAYYFSPGTTTAAPGDRSAAASGIWLRLHRIRAGTHLKSKAVYRDSAFEVGFDEERRWAELPEDYLRRVLSWELYERRGLRRVVSGSALTLEVELTDFDQIRGDKPLIRVAAVMLLHDLGRAQHEETIVIDKPLPKDKSDDPRVIAKVTGEALQELVTRIADRVISKGKDSQGAGADKPAE